MVDAARKALAVLIGLRALTNLGKPFGAGSGFVVLGHLLHGLGSAVLGPLVGIVMLVYAWGLFGARPWARPLALGYAVWATLNVVLFPIFEDIPAGFSASAYALFGFLGIAGPWLAVWLLGRSTRRSP